MAEVQIRRGRIKARLDAQRASRCKPLLQFVFKQQFMRAAIDLGQRILMCHFSHIRYQFKFRKKPSYRSFPFSNHSSGEFYRLIFLPPSYQSGFERMPISGKVRTNRKCNAVAKATQGGANVNPKPAQQRAQNTRRKKKA